MISFAKYYRKLVNEVTVYLSELVDTYDEEAIHQMRIAYKRIRAMNKFILAEYGGNKEIHDQIKILDTIYRNTGIIREIQVSIILLDIFRNKLDKSFDKFYEFLDNRLNEIKSVLSEEFKGFDIESTKRYKSKMYLLLKEANQKKLFIKAVKFIKKRVRKTESRIFERSDKGRYHKIRTNTKEEYFFLRLLFSKDDCQKSNFRLKYLKKLGVKLGKWHDMEIFLEYIHFFTVSKYSAGQLGPGSEYNLLIKHADRRQEKALKKIDREIIKGNRDLLEYLVKYERKLK
jgi:CHAD domain-containing protein